MFKIVQIHSCWILPSHQTVTVNWSFCRCAEGQGTRTLQPPGVTLELGLQVELIPYPTPLQRKSVGAPVCWGSQTLHKSWDVCGDLGSYGSRWRTSLTVWSSALAPPHAMHCPPLVPSPSHSPLTSTPPSQHPPPSDSWGEELDSIHSWNWTSPQSAAERGRQGVSMRREGRGGRGRGRGRGRRRAVPM